MLARKIFYPIFGLFIHTNIMFVILSNILKAFLNQSFINRVMLDTYSFRVAMIIANHYSYSESMLNDSKYFFQASIQCINKLIDMLFGLVYMMLTNQIAFMKFILWGKTIIFLKSMIYTNQLEHKFLFTLLRRFVQIKIKIICWIDVDNFSISKIRLFTPLIFLCVFHFLLIQYKLINQKEVLLQANQIVQSIIFLQFLWFLRICMNILISFRIILWMFNSTIKCLFIIVSIMLEEKRSNKYDETSSTSSGFYTPNHLRNNLKAKSNPKSFSTTFPNISSAIHLTSQTTKLNKIEQDINKLQKFLQTNEYQLQKMINFQEIQKIITSLVEEVKNLSAQTQQQTQQIKEWLQCQIVKFEKQLCEIQKSWKNLKEKYSAELDQAVKKLKEDQKINQADINKKIKLCCSAMREQVHQLGNEIKALKKQRGSKKNNNLDRLQMIKQKYLKVLKEQQIRRNQCDKVMYDLLEGACNKGENSIRRAVF